MPDYRELKNRTRFSTTIDNDLYKQFKEYASSTDVPTSKLIDRAIQLLLESVRK